MKLILSVLLMFVSLSSFADSLTGSVNVLRVEVDKSFIKFNLKTAAANLEKCNNSLGVLLLPAHPARKEIYTAVMASKATKTAVQFNVSGCSSAAGAQTLPVVRSVTYGG